MKTAIYTILIALCLALAGCTQNNGNIGPLFGSWHLESMEADGAPVPQPTGTDAFWNFQGPVLMAILSEGMYEQYTYDGTWEQPSASALVLDFTHSCNDDAPGTGHYRAPWWMGFPENEILHLEILRLNGKNLDLRWVSGSGEVYTYKFKKTW